MILEALAHNFSKITNPIVTQKGKVLEAQQLRLIVNANGSLSIAGLVSDRMVQLTLDFLSGNMFIAPDLKDILPPHLHEIKEAVIRRHTAQR